jgi:hypothetical protein
MRPQSAFIYDGKPAAWKQCGLAHANPTLSDIVPSGAGIRHFTVVGYAGSGGPFVPAARISSSAK